MKPSLSKWKKIQKTFFQERGIAIFVTDLFCTEERIARRVILNVKTVLHPPRVKKSDFEKKVLKKGFLYYIIKEDML